MYFNDEYFTSVIDGLKKLDEVDAVVLGGSRSTGESDAKSDYDIYVYCSAELLPEKKGDVLKPFCSVTEIGNYYWESEDNCVLNNGVSIDVIYRRFEMITGYLKYVVDENIAFNGYTTCFLHNIINSKILFDKSGKFTELQKKYSAEYPEKLRQNIITKNRKLLSGVLPSYDMQIKKAAQRNDLVSVHHRITEFLASYFDIIFALNRLTHPGEKRLVSLCKKHCSILPENFEENINALLASVTKGNSYDIVCDMVAEIDKIIQQDKANI